MKSDDVRVSQQSQAAPAVQAVRDGQGGKAGIYLLSFYNSLDVWSCHRSNSEGDEPLVLQDGCAGVRQQEGQGLGSCCQLLSPHTLG